MNESNMSLNVYTVSFFGHRVMEDPLPLVRRLETLIRRLLKEKEYIEFLVGRDGEFDQIVSSTVRCCKRTIRADNSALVWVMPYITAEYRDNENSFRDYYDEIEVCGASAGVYFKGAIQARNREMVDRSNLVVFCIYHESGGAWQTMKYAKKQGKACVNIADLPEKMEY